MIELVVKEYLEKTLNLSVYFERPKNPPNRYVLLDKTGSGKENHICSAVFAVQSYAPSLLQAAELNEEVKAAMDNLVVLDNIGKSELNTDYPYTDTTRKEYRYQAIYEITY